MTPLRSPATQAAVDRSSAGASVARIEGRVDDMTVMGESTAVPTAGLMGEPADGRFGEFGGRFVPETLVPACEELEAAFRSAWAEPAFRERATTAILRDYAGRPSMLTECHNLGRRLGLRLLLKREDLNHTGSHKINNVLGQALLATRMGKPRFIAETGAGQHGVAAATAAALMGLECKVYMGAVDVAPPGAERLPHAPARRRGGSGRERQPHAQGRGERGAARLGGQRRATATTASARSWGRTRTRGWCASSTGSSATRRASSAAR